MIVSFTAVSLRLHLSVNQFAHLYDGNSYLITAQAMLGDRAQFSEYHGRVFPGFPAMIASRRVAHRFSLSKLWHNR